MSILQIKEKLESSGRSLKASGASNGQSIAGATATGTHGAAYNVGAVHDAIVGLHVIVGPARHVWIEKKSNPIASDEFINCGAEKISDDDFFNAVVVSSDVLVSSMACCWKRNLSFSRKIKSTEMAMTNQ
jgi:FAD/FMN-containing dehydrogenase